MRAGLTAAVLLFGALACGGAEEGTTELVVSAASSLTDVFAVIESQFEQANPGVDVLLNIGGSSLLREQILGGAPVDVFASANPEIMNELVAAGLIRSEAEVFALNSMVIAVPLGNPGRVHGLEDFANDALLMGLCAPEVPCGQFARQALESAGVEPSVDSEEPSVRALLVKLEAGELDAGVVYQTDLTGRTEVEGLAIPDEFAVSTAYVIAAVAETSQLETASQFIAFVRSDAARRTLSDHGFDLP